MIPKSEVEKSDFEIIGFGSRGVNTPVYSSESTGVNAEVTSIRTAPGGFAHRITVHFTGYMPSYRNFRPRVCHIKGSEWNYVADVVKFSEEDDEMVFCLKPRT